METSEKLPFKSLEEYLKRGIYKDLKHFKGAYLNEEFGPRLIDVDEENYIIKYLKDSYEEGEDEYTKSSFEEQIRFKLQGEIRKLLDLIEIGFIEKFSDGKEILGYANFLELKLNQIKNLDSYEKFDFLKEYIDKVQNQINFYIPEHPKKKNIHTFNYSFNIITESEKDQKLKVDTLFDLLTDMSPLIDSTREEFHNAFTGNEVTVGIKWLVIGKNKLTSKVSLFYFVNELIDQGLIERSIINDLIKYVGYVFRDKNGFKFKNLKNSKSTSVNKTSEKERLDSIITVISSL